jgi:hypothetical protein
MTMHRERLDCPLCGAGLVSFNGLGTVGDDLLRGFRQAVAEHRPDCAGPSPVSAPPALSARPAAEQAS